MIQEKGKITATAIAAFPVVMESENYFQEGMLLRDYFAAKVLSECVKSCSTYSRAAEEAYKVADAMIEARKK